MLKRASRWLHSFCLATEGAVINGDIALSRGDREGAVEVQAQ